MLPVMPMPTLLILPGLLEDADGFEHQIVALREGATALAADLTRGESMQELARHALEQAPDGPLAVMGHSMGGYVALELLRQAPQRVDRVAFVNTNARPDTPESTANRRRLMELAEKDFPAVINTLLPKLVTAAHLAEVGISGKITEMALATGREAFVRQEKAIIGRVDSRPFLAQIRCPALVVAGDQDQLMPVEVLKELADGIPGARLEVVKDSGHMTSLEQPAALTRLLRDWLAA
jgi:pimeloyl-ACP methyl ester carboxylesterase